jgi:chaperone required for assembly of F1-ATPase
MRVSSVYPGLANLQTARPLALAALAMTFAAFGAAGVGVALARNAEESASFNGVYYAALLSGRDADAAVRKAHFRADLLVEHFGMTRSEAAAEAARSVALRTTSLCVGN